MEIVILSALIGLVVIFIILIRDGRKSDYYGKAQIKTPYRTNNTSQGRLVQNYKVSHSMSAARDLSKSAPVMREAIEKVAEVPLTSAEAALQESLQSGTQNPTSSNPAPKKTKAERKAAAKSAMAKQSASDAKQSVSGEEEFSIDRFWKLKKERAEQKQSFEVLSVFTGFGGFLLSVIGAVVFILVGIYVDTASPEASLIPIVIALVFAWNAKKQFRNLFNKES